LVCATALVGLGLSGGARPSPAGADPAGAETFSFVGEGIDQTYVVPDGVTSLQVELLGAEGGDGGTCGRETSACGNGGRAGLGALVVAALPVTPGQTLTVRVGAQGLAGGISSSSNIGGPGGFGGGASMISDGTTRLAVAGGGGGGGGGGFQPVFQSPAVAGGRGGGSDADGFTSADGGCNGGGGYMSPNPTIGGAGGVAGDCQMQGSASGTAGQPGSADAGGAGGTGGSIAGYQGGAGGGGGGGYHGGGGGGGGAADPAGESSTVGAGGGGAGGRSYSISEDWAVIDGFNTGDGLVAIVPLSSPGDPSLPRGGDVPPSVAALPVAALPVAAAPKFTG
jgi:hypothetical protein